MANAPLIDPESLATFRDLGDAEFVRSFLTEVLASLPPRLAAIQAGIDQADPKILSFEAHALKSSCANCGIESMRKLCADLETMGRAGSVDVAAATQMHAELMRFGKELELEIHALPEFAPD